MQILWRHNFYCCCCLQWTNFECRVSVLLTLISLEPDTISRNGQRRSFMFLMHFHTRKYKFSFRIHSKTAFLLIIFGNRKRWNSGIVNRMQNFLEIGRTERVFHLFHLFHSREWNSWKRRNSSNSGNKSGWTLDLYSGIEWFLFHLNWNRWFGILIPGIPLPEKSQKEWVLSCLELRFRLLAIDNSLHSGLSLAFRQYKLHNIFIFGMAYTKAIILESMDLKESQVFWKSHRVNQSSNVQWIRSVSQFWYRLCTETYVEVCLVLEKNQIKNF